MEFRRWALDPLDTVLDLRLKPPVQSQKICMEGRGDMTLSFDRHCLDMMGTFASHTQVSALRCFVCHKTNAKFGADSGRMPVSKVMTN